LQHNGDFCAYCFSAGGEPSDPIVEPGASRGYGGLGLFAWRFLRSRSRPYTMSAEPTLLLEVLDIVSDEAMLDRAFVTTGMDLADERRARNRPK
jgi:hypothetical protein